MSKKSEMKSVQFKRLLPDIYKKLIIEHFTHVEVSKWLLESHGLDLMGKNQDAKPFSNYLSVYGAIKTAKTSYAVNVDNQEHIAQHWYRKFTDADEKAIPKKVATKPLGTTSTDLDEEEVSVVPESNLRQAEKYRQPKPKKLSVADALNGYENKL